MYAAVHYILCLDCCCRRRSDDHGGYVVHPSAQPMAELAEMGEGSSEEEGDDDEPIYDQPEGDDEFLE